MLTTKTTPPRCTPRSPGARRLAVTLLAALGMTFPFLPAVAQPNDTAQGVEGSYGYIRVLEGSATLFGAGAGSRGAAAQINQPVLPGDRILVSEEGRAEIVLPDRNLLRLDGGSGVFLEQLAGSADEQRSSGDGVTRLRIDDGNAQLVVVEDALGDELPRIDTPNASLYIQYPGTYRITSDRGDWSSVVVRRGSVEVVTDRGSVRVRADEEAQIEGNRDARAVIAQASGFDAIERWGRDLETQVADNGYLDESLRYQGGNLSRYGSWIDVENHHYWRPTVEGGWRPFTDGYWTYTPAGQTWVATEPWGWVPYHYGSWDYLADYGWVWEAGNVFSPAWVYWYWGPTYVGWCPIGFYTGWYGRRFHDPSFRFGVYGWAGGDWGLFSHWTFVGTDHFGHRDLHRWARRSDDLRGDLQGREMPRGLITTDTRGITPGRVGRPQEVLDVLRRRVPAGNGNDLPDVNAFVARRPQLPPRVMQTVLDAGPVHRNRLAGTPLRPVTLGIRPPAQNPGDARGRWAARTGAPDGRGYTPASPASPTPGTRTDRFGRRGLPTAPAPHAWDRPSGAPRPPLTTARPDPADRTQSPQIHTWDRPATSPRDRPATITVLPPAQRNGERPSPTSRPSPSPATQDRWRSRPASPGAPAPSPSPERWQRPSPQPAPAPRSAPPPRYAPPPQRPSAPPPQPQREQRERPPEHHGR